jgi:hypothetical protein
VRGVLKLVIIAAAGAAIVLLAGFSLLPVWFR